MFIAESGLKGKVPPPHLGVSVLVWYKHGITFASNVLMNSPEKAVQIIHV